MFCSQCLDRDRQGNKIEVHWRVIWRSEETYQISMFSI